MRVFFASFEYYNKVLAVAHNGTLETIVWGGKPSMPETLMPEKSCGC